MARLSIVISFLNEEENIPYLYERIADVVRQMPSDDVEIVFVDDGSTDGSVPAVRKLPRTGPAIRLVRLSRNFGSHAALTAGIAHSTGDAIAFIAADLQDPPELILRLMEQWRAGYEIVWATREIRDDPWATKFFARLYYFLLRRFALPQMPPGGVDVCLVDRQVVNSLGNLHERNTSIFCLLMWAGFSQTTVPYHRHSRRAGRSKWSLGKKFKLFIDSFISFSFFPMRLISWLGAFVSALGILYAALIAVQALFFRVAVQGWSSLMISVLLLSGLQLLILGILCEYLWRALDEARNRPTYIVREVEALAEGPCSGTTRAGSADSTFSFAVVQESK